MKKLVDVTTLLVNEEDSSINPKYYFNPNSDYIEERKHVAIQLLQEGHDVFQVAELCALSVRAVRFLQDPSSISFMEPKKRLQCEEAPKSVNVKKVTRKKVETVKPKPIEKVKRVKKEPAKKAPYMSEVEKRAMIREIIEMVQVAKESVKEVKTND